MMYINLIFGLVLVILGAEGVVRGGIQLALALRIPVIVVALVLVGFGTSAPEITVSITAAIKASTEMAMGNILGSIIANISLVLGLSALVHSIKIEQKLFKREILIALILQMFLLLFLFNNNISRVEGALFVLAGVIYNIFLIKYTLKERDQLIKEKPDITKLEEKYPWWISLAITIAGLVIMVFGSGHLVKGASALARELGMSDRLIGLTIVAIGTSAPELATSLIAAIRHQADICIGNIIGSNIFNLTAALGITSIISPIKIQPIQINMTRFDAITATVLTLILYVILHKSRKLSRLKGALLLCSYVFYIGFIIYSK